MILKTSEKESERWFKAYQHDAEMQEKYGRLNGMSAAFDDYHYWYEERTDKPGHYRHDYPLPYSQQHYFRRFVELFFSTGAERHLLPTLAHEFLGDEVDADYINGLLISAEQYGFFNPGAIIIFNGATISWLPPPATKGGRYTLAQSNDIHQQVYEGSKANKERAKVVRKWLKRRAAELATVISPAQTAPPVSSITIEELCISSFTPEDLTALLQHLEVVNASGKDLTSGSRGKARSIWGRFTAAYRVLQRRGLMDRTANDAEWAKAFMVAYGVNLGPEARGHQLNAHGHGHHSTPEEFRKAVDSASLWVSEWQQNRPKEAKTVL